MPKNTDEKNLELAEKRISQLEGALLNMLILFTKYNENYDLHETFLDAQEAFRGRAFERIY